MNIPITEMEGMAAFCYNNMKLTSNLSKIFLLVLTASIVLSGCNRKDQNMDPQAQQMKAQEEADKVPKDLENIENSIEKIMKILDGPSVSLEDEKKEDKASEKTSDKAMEAEEDENKNQAEQSSKKDNEGQEGKQDGKQQKDNDKGDNQQAQKTTPEPKDPWKEISPIINNLHYQSNGYLPSATKKNASRQLIDNFSNALNTLTSTILTKDKNNTLLAANNLYSYVPDFYMLYRTETSPEIKRIRYYARNVVLNATVLNWDQALKDVENLKDTWAIYKNTIDPKNQELASKLDYSIYELETVVNEKNLSLTDIKGRIALSNMESLEKAAKEDK